MPFQSGYKPWNAGLMSSATAPTEHPTTQDICWAAGIYEGEGTCCHRASTGADNCSVTQKDAWLPNKLRDLFGGKVYYIQPKSGDNHYRWMVWGARARGFLLTTYKFLSPRRQAQIRQLLQGS